MALSEVPGVFIAFDRKILLGCRAVKAKTVSFNAFQTINREPVGVVSSHGRGENRRRRGADFQRFHQPDGS